MIPVFKGDFESAPILYNPDLKADPIDPFSESFMMGAGSICDDTSEIGGGDSFSSFLFQRVSNFYRQSLLPRVQHLIKGVPTELVSGGYNAYLAVRNVVPAILFQNTYTVEHTLKYFNGIQECLPKIYMHLLKTMNSNADFIYKPQVRKGEYFVSRWGNGLLTNKVFEKIEKVVEGWMKTQSFFKRQIASRGAYLLYGIAAVVFRSVDLVIGVAAAVFSVMRFGQVGLLNNVAWRGLQVLGLAKDIVYCAIKILNPTSSFVVDNPHGTA